MRVNQSGNNQVQNSEASRVKVTRSPHAKGTEKAGAAESSSTEGSSPVSAQISSKAKEFSKAKEVAAHAPDVREERVAALKARIAAGKYNVDADAVADRMVDDHIKMHGIG